MRIITGTARGKKLKTLEGENTRPTTDRVKESIFNIIQFDIPGRTVLDLFAGSGQLGIEALSRGAMQCVFVDQNSAAIKIIRENINHVGFRYESRIIQCDAASFIRNTQEKFDIIFLDPPYHSGLMQKILILIAEFDILSKNGIIICESKIDAILHDSEFPYSLKKEYKYGKTKITLYGR